MATSPHSSRPCPCGARMWSSVSMDDYGRVWHCFTCEHEEPREENLDFPNDDMNDRGDGINGGYRMEDLARLAGLAPVERDEA